jgi:hypothetical protein
MLSVMGSRTIQWTLLVSAVVAGIPAQFGGVASAGTVELYSAAGTGSNSVTGTNYGIVVSPVWAPGGPGYGWVSYNAGTGCNTFNPLTGRCTAGPENPPGATEGGPPTATFYQTFTVTDASDSGTLNVWADDTASVWLDTGTVTSGTGTGGTDEFALNWDPGSDCSIAPISCLAGEGAAIPLDLTAGTYTLVINAYQYVGGSPFGIMYDGVLTGSAGTVPEPASYLLMGLGLAGLGTLMRRKRA